MILRRTIAAFLVFALAGLASAPAFAGVLSCAIDGEDDGCCCANEHTNEVADAEAPDCDCPSCACVLGKADATVPFYPTTAEVQLTLDGVSTASSDIPSFLTVGAETKLAVPEARGPPGGSPAPLYLLYDTLLI